MRVRLAVPLLAVLPSVVSADLYVKGQNERITVKASREPLARVLAGIAQGSPASPWSTSRRRRPSSSPSRSMT